VKDGASAGRLAGTIAGRQDRRTRKGTPMMILTLSDQSGSYEVIAFSEQINEFGAILSSGKSVILQVGADERADGVSLRLLSAELIEGVAEKVDRRLTVFAADAPNCARAARARSASSSSATAAPANTRSSFPAAIA
jgi:DNA polymerase-3 subunit alpha